MLREERTYINLSFGLYLELMKRQARLRRQMLHQKICNKLFSGDSPETPNPAYHCIYAFSVSLSNLVYLKDTLKPSPETFSQPSLHSLRDPKNYAVMLLPYRHDLGCSELSAKHHDTINSISIFEEQKQHLTKRRVFCFFSKCRFTSPSTLLKLDVLLMSRKLLFLTIYLKDIITFGMYQYLSESFFREHINQFLRAILPLDGGTSPAIKGDWEYCQINAFLLKEIKHLVEHVSVYVWFGSVSPALLTDRPDIEGYYPYRSMTVSSTQRVIFSLERVAGLLLLAFLIRIDAIWHPVTSKSFLDRKTLHALMAEYTLFLSIHKVCTNLFFRCTAEREWLGVNMSKICPEASINNTSIALIAF